MLGPRFAAIGAAALGVAGRRFALAAGAVAIVVVLPLADAAPASAAACQPWTFSTPPYRAGVSSGNLPNAPIGVPYRATVTVSGNAPAAGAHYFWSLSGGNLPPGLTWKTEDSTPGSGLKDRLVIYGTPTGDGSNGDAIFNIDNNSGQGMTCSFSDPNQNISRWQVKSGKPPVNTTAPSVPNDPIVGQQIDCNKGAWQSSTPLTDADFGYQWLRGDNVITSGKTYTVQQADTAGGLHCHVTATNEFGGTVARSNSVTGHSPPILDAHPTIAGLAHVGEHLECVKGAWSGDTPISYKYEWVRDDGTHVADGAFYTPGDSDVNKKLRCKVTASNAWGHTEALTLDLVSVSPRDPPVNGSPPAVSDANSLTGSLHLVVGQRLRCDPGQWHGMQPITFTYAWLRDGALVGGDQTYEVTPADRGKTLVCRVTAHNADTPAGTEPSADSDRESIPANDSVNSTIVSVVVKGWVQSRNIEWTKNGGPPSEARPQTDFVAGEAVQIEVTLKNLGGRGNCAVSVVVNGGAISRFSGGAELASGEARTFTFRAVAPNGNAKFGVATNGNPLAGATVNVYGQFDVLPTPQLEGRIKADPKTGKFSGKTGPPQIPQPRPRANPTRSGSIDLAAATGDATQTDHVDVAFLRLQGKLKAARGKPATCSWLAGPKPKPRPQPATNSICATPLWLRAHGTTKWSYQFRGHLPKGRYIMYVRAVDRAGLYDPIFSPSKHNKLAFTVR